MIFTIYRYCIFIIIVAFLMYVILWLPGLKSRRAILHKEVKLAKGAAFRPGTFSNLKSQLNAYNLFCVYYRFEPFPCSIDILCTYTHIFYQKVSKVCHLSKTIYLARRPGVSFWILVYIISLCSSLLYYYFCSFFFSVWRLRVGFGAFHIVL
jgi:hypothetical protein